MTYKVLWNILYHFYYGISGKVLLIIEICCFQISSFTFTAATDLLQVTLRILFVFCGSPKLKYKCCIKIWRVLRRMPREDIMFIEIYMNIEHLPIPLDFLATVVVALAWASNCFSYNITIQSNSIRLQLYPISMEHVIMYVAWSKLSKHS